MASVLSELPLALFTTLAPLGAGAFIALAVAFMCASFDEAQLKRIDKMTSVPVIIAIIGFICTFFHVASPLKAYGIFSGTGSSPLSNEIVVGIVFMVLACIYAILGLVGKLGGARKALAVITGIAAAIFAVFMGLAYLIPTVASWNSALNCVEMVGYCIVGGSATGALVLALAKVGDKQVLSNAARPLIALVIIGEVLAVVGLAFHVAYVSGSDNAVTDGGALVMQTAPLWVIGLVLIIIAGCELVRGLRVGLTCGIAVRATCEAAVGILLARLAFYAMYLSVGVTMM